MKLGLQLQFQNAACLGLFDIAIDAGSHSALLLVRFGPDDWNFREWKHLRACPRAHLFDGLFLGRLEASWNPTGPARTERVS